MKLEQSTDTEWWTAREWSRRTTPEGDRHEAALPGFGRRLGLTEWAQMWYPYERSIEQHQRNLGYDLCYVRRASVWLDLRVLARTVLCAEPRASIAKGLESTVGEYQAEGDQTCRS